MGVRQGAAAPLSLVTRRFKVYKNKQESDIGRENAPERTGLFFLLCAWAIRSRRLART